MIPLLLLVLVIGAGLATYEFSPRAHAWVDAHVRALRGALASHQEADAHLVAARGATVAGDQMAAAEHVLAATAANREAARQTAAAAGTAGTTVQRSAAAASADRVTGREREIAEALASLGVGQCDARSYERVTPRARDVLLARLRDEGMTVTGDNPWEVETHQYDVRLRAAWDPREQVLRVIVTSGAGGYLGLVSCDAIWARVDPVVREVLGR